MDTHLARMERTDPLRRLHQQTAFLIDPYRLGRKGLCPRVTSTSRPITTDRRRFSSRNG